MDIEQDIIHEVIANNRVIYRGSYRECVGTMDRLCYLMTNRGSKPLRTGDESIRCCGITYKIRDAQEENASQRT